MLQNTESRDRGIYFVSYHNGIDRRFTRRGIGMSSLDVEDFINELKKGPERLVKISRMPEETRCEAIRGLGYGFTAREDVYKRQSLMSMT